MNLKETRVMLFPSLRFAESGSVKHNQTSRKHSLGGILWCIQSSSCFDVTTSEARQARLTMVCLRRVDLSVKVRQQRPHM